MNKTARMAFLKVDKNLSAYMNKHATIKGGKFTVDTAAVEAELIARRNAALNKNPNADTSSINHLMATLAEWEDTYGEYTR